MLSDLEIRVPLVFLHCEIYHTLNLNRSVIPQLSIKGGYCRRIIARECDIRGTVHLKEVQFDEGIDFSHAKIGGAFYVEQSQIGLDAINKSHYVVYNHQKCSLSYSDRNKHSEAICENCDDFCKNTLKLTRAKIAGALCIHHTEVHNGIDLFGAHIDSQVKFFYSTFKIGCHKKNNRNSFDGRMQNMKIGEDLTIEKCSFKYGLDISSSSIERELDLDGLESSSEKMIDFLAETICVRGSIKMQNFHFDDLNLSYSNIDGDVNIRSVESNNFNLSSSNIKSDVIISEVESNDLDLSCSNIKGDVCIRSVKSNDFNLSCSKIGGDVRFLAGEAVEAFVGQYSKSKLKYVLNHLVEEEKIASVEEMNVKKLIERMIDAAAESDSFFLKKLKKYFQYPFDEHSQISFKEFFVFLLDFLYKKKIKSHRKLLNTLVPAKFLDANVNHLLGGFLGDDFSLPSEKLRKFLDKSLREVIGLTMGKKLLVYKSRVNHLAIDESVIQGNLVIGVKEPYEDYYPCTDPRLTIGNIDARRVQVYGNFTIDQCNITADGERDEKYPSTINIERAMVHKSLKIKNISIRRQISLYHSDIGMELVLENIYWKVAGEKSLYLRKFIDDVDYLLELSNATCCSFYNNLLKIYETNGLKAFHKNQEKSPDKNQTKRPIMSNGFQYEIMYVDASAMPELKSVLGFLKLCEYSPHTYIQAAKSYLRFGSDAKYNKVLFEMNLEEYHQLKWRVPWFRFKIFPNREKIFGFFKRYSCGWGFHKIMIPFWLCFLGLVGTLCHICGSYTSISQVSVEEVLVSMAFSLYQMIPLTFDFFEKPDNITVYLQFYWIFHKVAGFVLLSLLLAAVSGLLGQVKKAEEFKQ